MYAGKNILKVEIKNNQSSNGSDAEINVLHQIIVTSSEKISKFTEQKKTQINKWRTERTPGGLFIM